MENTSYSEICDTKSIKSQIERLDMELYPFGYSFWDVEKDSPRKSKDIYRCADVIKALIDDQKLMGSMLQKGFIPIKPLSKRTKVSSKLIEAHEGYIVMAALVLTGNYPDLQLYYDFIFDEE
ncbi:hypothetical protein [Butyrivibrio fibrisolvens]|uniref:hypothetical protein n=1 Tax=Butyrivibrio fibrisolvens TaxID=831 RepID=UPI00041CE363|nr:hypothetical protein [Butyrivibrio fibrisolvens]